MTSRIIAAIVAVFAVVLSLAAPVAVDAQTPTLTVEVNTIGATRIAYSGFTVGTYYEGSCWDTASIPASCTFDSMGFPSGGEGFPCSQAEALTGTSGSLHGYQGLPDNALLSLKYRRHAVYSDSACTTEVAAATYEKPTTFPNWNVRDVTDTSATIYIEGPFNDHRILEWKYVLTPGPRVCTRVVDYYRSAHEEDDIPPTTAPLSGLSPGTNYLYQVYQDVRRSVDLELPCTGEPAVGTVRFTTLPSAGSGPPPPEPPSGVDGGEPTTDVNGGSVTISWENPGDPDIVSYEYLLQGGRAVGEWRTVSGSNADTTSVTIDLATGAAVAVNNATPPMVEWTIHLRARDVNGNAGGIFTTTVAASAGEMVPALPLAGLAMLALFLFMSGQRQRKGG